MSKKIKIRISDYKRITLLKLGKLEISWLFYKKYEFPKINQPNDKIEFNKGFDTAKNGLEKLKRCKI